MHNGTDIKDVASLSSLSLFCSCALILEEVEEEEEGNDEKRDTERETGRERVLQAALKQLPHQ